MSPSPRVRFNLFRAGPELAKLGAGEFVDAARRATVIGRLTLAQKARVVAALKDARHTGTWVERTHRQSCLDLVVCHARSFVLRLRRQRANPRGAAPPPAVGFLGDGINDALALRTADVGEAGGASAAAELASLEPALSQRQRGDSSLYWPPRRALPASPCCVLSARDSLLA